MAAAAALFRRASSHLARFPRPLFPSDSLESPFAHGSSAGSPSLPGFSFDASMELMAVPKKNVRPHPVSFWRFDSPIIEYLLLTNVVECWKDLFSFSKSLDFLVCQIVSRHKKGLRNGPKALKPVPVIVRCK
ncbi:unnamed protein product [Musa acuminata subsp. burmannicoides]